jgi:hypothetical protein
MASSRGMNGRIKCEEHYGFFLRMT